MDSMYCRGIRSDVESRKVAPDLVGVRACGMREESWCRRDSVAYLGKNLETNADFGLWIISQKETGRTRPLSKCVRISASVKFHVNGEGK